MATQAGPVPSSAGWDGMSEWYRGNMSPATASLATSLAGQLGLFTPKGQPGCADALDFVETHCGDARATECFLAMAQRPGNPTPASYTATDFSEVMVGEAGKRLEGLAKVVVADSTALPFEDASFDRYLSNMGACCVSDLDGMLREVKRVLRPGGIAALSTRVEGGAGDSSFAAVSKALQPFGYPPGPDREGLHIGKDPERFREKLTGLGFSRAIPWKSWVVLPIHDAAAFQAFAVGQCGVRKFLSSLEEPKQEEAKAALLEAGKEVLAAGAVQIAVAAVVAYVD